ncbi:uracil-DNA glycosylase [candidate division KSB1 bacterium]|nr:uracil-DNA glycosylase [candidate division KSB1 bacterium]
MKDAIKQFERLLDQQIELYGDEEALPREALQTFLPPKESPEALDDWQDSKNLFLLQDRIKSCVKCPLGYSRRSFVFGNGNAEADIMLIGEAPGEEEDQQGFVFVGRAGQLLDKILKAIDLDRAQVYITNLLKCHPPKNRDPQSNELASCLPYLIKQIELIRPAFILCMGRFAAQTLLQSSLPLSQLRTKIHFVHGASVVVTYHPAALLRYPEFKRAVWDDVRLLRKSYDEWLNQKS